ncbi:MAG: hypothetical protein ACRCYO_06330 [Bacteroidia bacterium]
MLDRLVRYFNLKGWLFSLLKGKTTFVIPMDNGETKFDVVIDVVLNDARITCFSIFNQVIAPANRNNIAEFITRVNYGSAFGSWEMDYKDGELRFKTALFAEGIELNDTILDNLIEYNIFCFGITYATILEVVAGKNPQDAYQALMTREI